MKRIHLLTLILSISTMLTAQTLRLHPKNPRIFEYKGKPTLIIGSGEHYGAVMNLAFDFKTYLQTLKNQGINQTRLFVGAHREIQGAFGIERNTMAMPDAQYICAWAKSAENTEGGVKFDLSRFDDAYFARLKEFLQLAQANDVIVEVCLFSSIYENGIWGLSPLNPKNNINNLPDLSYKKIHTTENQGFQPFLTAYVQKVVTELNGFDNIYFEIQNEPWSDNGVFVGTWDDFIQGDMLKSGGNIWRTKIEVANKLSLEWQAGMARLIRETEEKMPKKHLISQNHCNFKHPIGVQAADLNVDILNFHYALPEVVAQNWYWNKPIGFNETGFAGKADVTYRRQAYRFIMSGGSLFSHLDYSFTVGNETGTDIANNAPGGGSPAFRESLRILRGVVEPEYRKNLQPISVVSHGVQTWALSDKKTVWLIYGEHYEEFTLQMDLPIGTYSVVQREAAMGKELSRITLISTKGKTAFSSNIAANDWILEVRKK
jgi:Cellulase (glycosyl hydrolase family 5)